MSSTSMPSAYRSPTWARLWNLNVTCVGIHHRTMSHRIAFPHTSNVAPLIPLAAGLSAILKDDTNWDPCISRLGLPRFEPDQTTR